ncbi:MAG TPA: class I adenylate-forming enzyme family protein [Novosphingobium sp.]|nr:class I adenylate-forming enzyme family protein [Novosphingobium sp.]
MFQLDLIAPVSELLRRQADRHGAKIAYRDGRRGVSYAQLDRRTGSLAGHLVDSGMQPGDAVAIYLPNSVEWVEACFAIVRAECVAVPISMDCSKPEVGYRLADSQCRMVITTSDRLRTIEALGEEASSVEHVICVDAGPEDAGSFENWAETPPTQSPRDPTDIDAAAFLIYTSGTTGQPKGVKLTCRSMLWVTAACWAAILELDENDTMLSPLPLFHSYALNLTVLSILATGASVYLMGKYSTTECFELLQSGEFTVFPGVPTMFHYLMEAARTHGTATLPGLRACVTAGAIMPAALNTDFEALFSVPLLDGYGITETSTMVTMNSATGGRVMGSCGLPIPGLAVRIVDPATLHDCDPGVEGELIVRGPNVMAGYLNKPEETAKALRNGWYHTGDLATADSNGFITITGRIKELIIRGGQNIAPAEIERVVLELEDVLDCAVVGLPHDQLGEVPGLFVIPRAPGFSEGPVLDHCRKHLSSYKVPHTVHVVDAIPRTGSGKIIRFRLRELVS